MSLPTPKNARKRVSIPPEYWHDRAKYRDEIFRDHIALARSIVHKFCSDIDKYQDLEQVALLALTAAIETYKPCKGAVFSTHATTKIKSDLMHHRRDNGPIPRNWMEKYKRVRTAHEQMALAGRVMPIEAVAKKMGITEWSEIKTAVQAPDIIPIDSLFDVASPSEDSVIDEHLMLRKALLKLPTIDRKILDDHAIGKSEGIDRERLAYALALLKTTYLEMAN